MTKRCNTVKRSIKVHLHECEINAARDWGMGEHEFMQLLVETVAEISDAYVEIQAVTRHPYDPQHMQRHRNPA